MQIRTVLALVTALIVPVAAGATPNSDWFRHATISPDGASIVFTSKGDIYRVASEGGNATPLTTHEAWDGFPVWSRDGKRIAFASDRHGNMDVFVMNSSGGKAERLTFDSRTDIPTDFSPDGSAVLFTSARMDNVRSSLFPRGSLNELYEITVTGGTPRMISTTSSSEARYSPDGSRIAYREDKAMESSLRKQDISAFARDLWILEPASGSSQHPAFTPR
jgi:Tol biopolymer transport system component